MVSEEVVLDTVKRMLDSGIEEGVIEDTLLGIGLKKEEAQSYIKKVKGGPPPEMVVEEKKEKEEKPEEVSAEKTAEKVKERLKDDMEAREAAEVATHIAIEEQGEKIGEVHKKIEALEKRIRKTPAGGIPDLEPTLEAMRRDISDTKALAAATKSVMEKVLETNRKILTKL